MSHTSITPRLTHNMCTLLPGLHRCCGAVHRQAGTFLHTSHPLTPHTLQMHAQVSLPDRPRCWRGAVHGRAGAFHTVPFPHTPQLRPGLASG
eukprot:352911-Chlamydomonas_euryale.AAC.8